MNVLKIIFIGVRAGDEEGQIEFRVEYEDDPIASVNLLISGMRIYLADHGASLRVRRYVRVSHWPHVLCIFPG